MTLIWKYVFTVLQKRADRCSFRALLRFREHFSVFTWKPVEEESCPFAKHLFIPIKVCNCHTTFFPLPFLNEKTLFISFIIHLRAALPIESCPSSRDQPLGSTATYNGKCYIFNNNHRLSFENARRACQVNGGSLVDETSPALQGFLSWELWRRHRHDPSGQYWMGAIRDPKDPKNWKWLNGQDVTSSFWNLPGGNDNCSRFDGTKEWLWSDTNCNLNLNYICQYSKLMRMF